MSNLYVTYRDEFISFALKYYSIEIEDAKDIFQEIIIDFQSNVMNNRLQTLTSSIKTYLFTIGKNKLINYHKKNQLSVTYRNDELIKDKERQNNQEGKEEADHYKYWKNKYLCECSDSCKKILELYYIYELSMDEIAKQMGYKNANVVKKTKFECLQKIKKAIKQKTEKESGKDNI